MIFWNLDFLSLHVIKKLSKKCLKPGIWAKISLEMANKKVKVEKLTEFLGHKDAIYVLSEAETPRFILSAGGEGMVVKWECGTDKPGNVIARLPAAIYSMVYYPEKEQLICGNRFGGVNLLDLANKEQKLLVDLKGSVFAMKEIPGKPVIIAGTGDGFLYFIDAESLEIKNSLKIADKSCRSITVSTDGKMAASGWSDNFIRLIDLDKMEITEAWEAHDNSVFSLAFSQDNKTLLSGGRDAQLKVWQLDGLQYDLFQKIPAHFYTINFISFHPDLNIFATASRDKTIKIWDGETYELLKVIDKEKFEGHTHSVNTLLWSKDGKTLFSAGDDRRIISWKLDFQ